MDNRALGLVSNERVSWRELRDESGRLYARLEVVTLRLEIRQHGEIVVFDLGQYVRRVNLGSRRLENRRKME